MRHGDAGQPRMDSRGGLLAREGECAGVRKPVIDGLRKVGLAKLAKT